MASASRLLPPTPPPHSAASPPARHRHPALAAPRSRRPINPPRLRCRAAAGAAATTTTTTGGGGGGGALVLEGSGAGAVAVREFVTLDELRAAVRLRIRTFYEYATDSYGAEVIDLI
jgi:hypothetical protein